MDTTQLRYYLKGIDNLSLDDTKKEELKNQAFRGNFAEVEQYVRTPVTPKETEPKIQPYTANKREMEAVDWDEYVANKENYFTRTAKGIIENYKTKTEERDKLLTQANQEAKEGKYLKSLGTQATASLGSLKTATTNILTPIRELGSSIYSWLPDSAEAKVTEFGYNLMGDLMDKGDFLRDNMIGVKQIIDLLDENPTLKKSLGYSGGVTMDFLELYGLYATASNFKNMPANIKGALNNYFGGRSVTKNYQAVMKHVDDLPGNPKVKEALKDIFTKTREDLNALKAGSTPNYIENGFTRTKQNIANLFGKTKAAVSNTVGKGVSAIKNNMGTAIGIGTAAATGNVMPGLLAMGGTKLFGSALGKLADKFGGDSKIGNAIKGMLNGFKEEKVGSVDKPKVNVKSTYGEESYTQRVNRERFDNRTNIPAEKMKNFWVDELIEWSDPNFIGAVENLSEPQAKNLLESIKNMRVAIEEGKVKPNVIKNLDELERKVIEKIDYFDAKNNNPNGIPNNKPTTASSVMENLNNEVNNELNLRQNGSKNPETPDNVTPPQTVDTNPTGATPNIPETPTFQQTLEKLNQAVEKIIKNNKDGNIEALTPENTNIVAQLVENGTITIDDAIEILENIANPNKKRMNTAKLTKAEADARAAQAKADAAEAKANAAKDKANAAKDKNTKKTDKESTKTDKEPTKTDTEPTKTEAEPIKTDTEPPKTDIDIDVEQTKSELRDKVNNMKGEGENRHYTPIGENSIDIITEMMKKGELLADEVDELLGRLKKKLTDGDTRDRPNKPTREQLEEWNEVGENRIKQELRDMRRAKNIEEVDIDTINP